MNVEWWCLFDVEQPACWWWCLMSEQHECWVVVFDVGVAFMLGGGV